MVLSDLRTLAKQKSDEVATSYIGNSEVDSYLNEGLNFVYGKIVQRFENYFIVQGTALNGGLFNTVSGTQNYAAPTSLYKLVRVEYRQYGSTNEDDFRPLACQNIGNDGGRNYYPPREGWGPGGRFGYFLAGNTFYLRPTPTSVYEVRVWFVPYVTEMTLDADVPNVPPPYHRLISEYAAIQILAKSGEPLWKERSDTFKLQLDNLIETIEIRNQNAEQMIITDDYSFDTPGFIAP